MGHCRGLDALLHCRTEGRDAAPPPGFEPTTVSEPSPRRACVTHDGDESCHVAQWALLASDAKKKERNFGSFSLSDALTPRPGSAKVVAMITNPVAILKMERAPCLCG